VTTTHPLHLSVQDSSAPKDAAVSPVPYAVSVSPGTGATALLPPHHPANTTVDNPVARWTRRLVLARPVDDGAA
jgi:hypothetical protein